jgi:hypothetical protein
LGWIDAPYTQNFEILKSLEQTQESKKIKISFEIFVKMLDGLNFGKRCLLGWMDGWISEGGVQPGSCTRASIRA